MARTRSDPTLRLAGPPPSSGKVHQVIEDASAAQDGLVHVVDVTGEAYLYLARYLAH